MSKVTLFYGVRHGSTALNGQRRFHGDIDEPLNTQGWKEASVVAYFLEPLEISHIISSASSRAAQTASVIARKKSQDFHQTDNLRAWKVGDFSGKEKNTENLKRFQWFIEHPDTPIPEGESLQDFSALAQSCFAEAIEMAERSGEPVLLVVHSTHIHEIGKMVHNDPSSVLIEPGGVVEVYAENGELGAAPIFKPAPRKFPPEAQVPGS